MVIFIVSILFILGLFLIVFVGSRKNLIEKANSDKIKALYDDGKFEEIAVMPLDLNKLDIYSLNLVLDSYRKTGQAQKVVDFSARFESDNVDFLNVLAVCHYDIGQKDKCFEILEGIIRDKSYFLVHNTGNTLAQLYFNDKNYLKCIETVQKLRLLDGDNYLPFELIADSFYELGNYDAAIDIFRMFTRRKYVPVECFYGLGRCFEAKNDKKNALKYYKKVQAKDFNYLDVVQKIEKLT